MWKSESLREKFGWKGFVDPEDELGRRVDVEIKQNHSDRDIEYIRGQYEKRKLKIRRIRDESITREEELIKQLSPIQIQAIENMINRVKVDRRDIETHQELEGEKTTLEWQIYERQKNRRDILYRENRNIIDKCIKIERKHCDKIPIYRGGRIEFWFFGRVVSLLRNLLDDSPYVAQTSVYIDFISVYNNTPTVKELFDLIFEVSYDLHEEYADIGFSFNPSLINNQQKDEYSTLHYFLEGDSTFMRKSKSLEDLFTALGCPKLEKSFKFLFEKLYYGSRYNGGTGFGYLYQILIDPEVINDLCYLSGGGGIPLRFEGEDKNTISDVRLVLEKMRRGEKFQMLSTRDEIYTQDEIQIRMHTNIADYVDRGQVFVYDYFNDERNIKYVDAKIMDLLLENIVTIVCNLHNVKDLYSREMFIQRYFQ